MNRQLGERLSKRWLCGLVVLCGLATGCQTYSTLRFRPVDTTSQMTLQDVRVLVSDGPAGPSARGITDQHGQVDLSNLKSGDDLLFVKDGYEPTRLKLEAGAFRQYSPASVKKGVLFDLRDSDVIPIPLHRVGAVIEMYTR